MVVTGASAGIGWATARSFAREGAVVVASARREERLRDLVTRIEKDGGTAVAVRCDVTSFQSVEVLRDRVEKEFARCDVLVNNAGVPGGGPFPALSLAQIEQVVATNYMGVLYGTKAFLPMMLAAGRGHVVNLASLAGRFATPGASVYSSTKHAVVAFSEALHYEVASSGLLVTSVNPGFVATEQFPHGDARAGRKMLLKVLRPDQIGDFIVEVVKKGLAPEASIPRWPMPFQAIRVLAPPVYRFGLRKMVERGRRPTDAAPES